MSKADEKENAQDNRIANDAMGTALWRRGTDGAIEITGRLHPEGLDYVSLQARLGADPVPVENTARRADQPTIYTPKRRGIRRQWQAAWRYIMRDVEKGKPLTEIAAWLQRTHPEVAREVDTLRAIVNAGEAGLLDS